jgi:proprotein convertase subtilisin/kexin type 5
MSLNCGCDVGKFDDGVLFNCSDCSFKCKSCVNNKNNCQICRGDRINAPSCVCPDGYYDDGISENCLKCDITCS